MAFRPTAKRLMLLRAGLGKNITRKGNPEGPTDSVLALVLSAAYCLSRRAVPTRTEQGGVRETPEEQRMRRQCGCVLEGGFALGLSLGAERGKMNCLGQERCEKTSPGTTVSCPKGMGQKAVSKK